jgi:hypothetical protein
MYSPFLCDRGPVSNLQFQDHVVIRGSCEGGARLALPIHDSNLEDCFRLGRNYTLAVTETVRGSELQHLTPREYPAGDQNVNRKVVR